MRFSGVSMISRLRTWWQLRTGEDDTPFDGDIPAWVVSVVLHLVLLFVIALLTIPTTENSATLTLTSTIVEPEPTVDPAEFEFSEIPVEDIGAESVSDVEIAISEAPEIAEIPEVSSPDLPVVDSAPVEFNPTEEIDTGLQLNEELAVKGAAGVGTTGASGAVDRLTHEIMLSIQSRPTTVIWMFDQSASLATQRQSIRDRFLRIHEELGDAISANASADVQTLLSSVVAFGETMTRMTARPTIDSAELQSAIDNIKRDNSGKEYVFSAIKMQAVRMKSVRKLRNVMIVVFTDEAGDDPQVLDECVNVCRRMEIPVYVVGIPAPFGRKKAAVKWVDPDPEYDQTPTVAYVNQGPETLFPERIKLRFPGQQSNDDPVIDSGFGPFALTRLCYESGGIYFAVHPNRRVGKNIRFRQTQSYTAYIKRFFEPEVMRRYRPEYVSIDNYEKHVGRSKNRIALVRAANHTWAKGLVSPRTRFVKSDDATFVRNLTTAQQAAASLQPGLDILYNTLKSGEADRKKERIARWQVGYDLAMGRALAAKVRTEGYNLMLAKAKQGMRFAKEKNNTWTIIPADTTELGSQMAKNAEKAVEYLERVVEEHPDTPWAYLAELDLKHPIGWKWKESYTKLAPPPDRQANANVPNRTRRPRDEQKRMLKKPKPKRAPPNL